MIVPRKKTPRNQRLPPCGGSGLKFMMMRFLNDLLLSPSVWREWIEIELICACVFSVSSPSVWREWIEIRC